MLAPPAGAEPCRAPAGAIESLATSLRAASAVDERDAVGSVVLAMFDGFGPMTDFQRRLIARLPKNVGVHLIVPPGSDYDEAIRAEFPDRRIEVVEAGLDANWSRDFVPEVVIGADGRATLVQFNYPRPESKASGAALAASLNLPLVTSDIRLDGGNILVDAAKSRLLLTERTLRDNPALTRAKIEKSLKASLGVKEIVWMPELPGEQTGHVDMFAKLVGDDTVLLARTRDPEKKKALDEAQSRLKAAGYRVRRVDLAGNGAGYFVPSYTNSLIIGKTAYVPTYAEVPAENHRAIFKKADAAAAEVYRSLGYKVVPMPSYYLLIQGGAVHCMTKTLPASILQ